MEFDLGFQRNVLALMMHNDSFGIRALEYLQPGFFQHEALGWIFKLYAHHWQEWSVRLTPVVVTHELRKLPQDKARLFEMEVLQVTAIELVANMGYIQQQLREFICMNLFVDAHREAAKQFEAGERALSYQTMREALVKAEQVTFEEPERQWFFEELDKRQKDRVARQMDMMRVPRMTGIADLDQRCDGGVHDGEVWAVFAYSKRCKSTWLYNQGFHSTRIHKMPTLHIALEGHPHQISAKYDSCFSRELYALVKRGDMNPEAYYHLQNDYAMLRKKMVIRHFSKWGTTMADVLTELNTLRAQGFEPRTVILDYVDRLKSRDPKCDSPTQHQIDATEDLKGITNERSFATWTAFQATRPKPGSFTKKHVLTSSNVADAYAKCRIVDSYGSLNATNEEMDNNEMRVYWQDHRDAPVGVLYRITNELATSRMIETSELIPFEDEEAA